MREGADARRPTSSATSSPKSSSLRAEAGRPRDEPAAVRAAGAAGVRQAQQIRPPGPLRTIHQQLVDSIELRARGWPASPTRSRPSTSRRARRRGRRADETRRAPAASDVVWEQLYQISGHAADEGQGVTGVVIPTSQFVPNTDLVSARSFSLLIQRLSGASAGHAERQAWRRRSLACASRRRASISRRALRRR